MRGFPFGRSAMKKTLIVAWDCADWEIITPLLERDQLPYLRSLLDRGVKNSVTTLQPQVHSLLWASIATGVLADKHGIHADLIVSNDGRARAVNAGQLKAKPFWHIAADSGLKSVVVNWPVTTHSEQNHCVVVTDRYPAISSDAEHHLPPASAIPESIGSELSEYALYAGELTGEQLGYLVDDIDQVDQEKDQSLSYLATTLTECINTHTAATWLMEHSNWDLCAIRYDFIDPLGQQFMPYARPKQPGVPDKLFNHYKNVMSRALVYMDLMLGRLIDLAGEHTNIILLSERGFQADASRVPWAALAGNPGRSAAWYRDQGILVMAGPDIDPDKSLMGAGLLDITPTVLALSGLPLPKGLDGRVLAECFNKKPKLEFSGTVARPETGDSVLTDAEIADDLARLVELGYVTEELLNTENLTQRIADSSSLNLAQVYMESNRPSKALPILQQLHGAYPEINRYALHLSRCYQATGNIQKARQTLQQVIDAEPEGPRNRMMLAELDLAENNYPLALVNLFRAEQTASSDPGIHRKIGMTYLKMQRWNEACRGFKKSIELDPGNSHSHVGLARACMGMEDYEAAAESALNAIEISFLSPTAHYWLGLALIKLIKYKEASEAFRVTVAVMPQHQEAHSCLARLYSEQLKNPEKAKQHQKWVARLIAKNQIDKQTAK